MTRPSAETYDQVIVQALESMAFMLAEESTDSIDALIEDAEHIQSVRISADELAGDVYVLGSSGFLVELAAGMLGMDEDEIIGTDYPEQAASELANVLAGEIVIAIGGAEKPISIGLPEAVTSEWVAEMLNSEQDISNICRLRTDFGTLMVVVKMSGA